MAEESKWYALRVVSGKERKLKEYLDKEVSKSGWSDFVKQIVVPLEKIYKIQNGKKVVKERNSYPGYILVEALPSRLSAEVIAGIRNLTGVIHFLGKEHPTPLKEAEVNKILGRADELGEMSETLVEPFLVGEQVKIIDGPFNDFKGTIEEIDDNKKKLQVTVSIFGRKQPVELNFIQVEKIV